MLLTGTTTIDFSQFAGIFDFIVNGVQTLCGLFLIFPINITLAAMLLGVTVTIIKKFMPSKKAA